MSEIVFGSNKTISENHMKFYYIFPLQTYSGNWTEFTKRTYKTHKNLVFSAAYCPFFSGISAVVLILLLGACESEEFPTAEYNKSQK